MKKWAIPLLLALVMLLTGCIYETMDTAVRRDGGGELSITFGLTQEVIDMMELQDEFAEEGFGAFTIDGVTYYGYQTEQSFSSPAEFNDTFSGALDMLEEFGMTQSVMELSRNSDGGLTLRFSSDTGMGLEEMQDELLGELGLDGLNLGGLSAGDLAGLEALEALEALTASAEQMTMRFTFRFDDPVRQLSGGAAGITIDGGAVTLDLTKTEDDSYLFTTSPEALPAFARTQTIDLDGAPVTLATYALVDENGGETNYIRLRDLASILNPTEARFAVAWDGVANTISLTPHTEYTPDGSEMNTPFHTDRSANPSAAATLVGGEAAALDAIAFADDNGGGYTYYKLRDLAGVLGFNVDWTAERGIFIESAVPYQG